MLVILHHSGFVSILAQLIMINDIVSKKCRNTIFPRKKQKISLINDLQCRNEIISFAKREPKTNISKILYKKDSIHQKIIPALKLPRFFPH